MRSSSTKSVLAIVIAAGSGHSALAAGGSFPVPGVALPPAWGVVAVVAILALALIIHLALVVRENRMAPVSLASDLDRTIRGGNYQEAWEMCRNRRGVYLAGISAAALEQVGNGLDAVIDARHESSAQAARPVRVPLWSLFGVAIAATLLTIWSLVHAMNWSGDISSAREWTLRSGVTSVSVAGWFAISVATWFYFLGFHRRARQWIHAADERIDAILSRLPYEDLEGVQIGAHFSAGPNLAEYGDEGFRTLRVSRELTTHCPECNGPVRSGAGACSKCGAILDWK